MERPVAVTIHPSCFPDRVRAAYLESFRTRRMNHRFHYESEKQAQQWLALHEAYSPARTDADCLQTYDRALAEIAAQIPSDSIALISIGCGGGQKDITLLKHLTSKNILYIPTDVSLPLALTAHHRANDLAHLTDPNHPTSRSSRREEAVILSNSSGAEANQSLLPSAPAKLISAPVLLDLSATPDLSSFLDSLTPSPTQRIIAFFGMLPNFEPHEALPILASALRPGDLLLASANLAPGPDYYEGVKKILPLYDNNETHRWLATALTDADLQIDPTEIQFTIVEANDLLRIEANYTFKTSQHIQIDQEQFTYSPNETFRLFYSYRHTPDLLQTLFQKHEMKITQQWITNSAEEEIFLAQRS